MRAAPAARAHAALRSPARIDAPLKTGRTSVSPNDMRHTLGPNRITRTHAISIPFGSLVFPSLGRTLRSFDPSLLSAQLSANGVRGRWAAASASMTAEAVLENRVKRVPAFASDAPEAHSSGTAHIRGLTASLRSSPEARPGRLAKPHSVCSAMRLCLRTAHILVVSMCAPHRRLGHMRPSDPLPA